MAGTWQEDLTEVQLPDEDHADEGQHHQHRLQLLTLIRSENVALKELESWRRIELPEDTKRDSGDMNPLLPSSTGSTTTHKCSTCNKVWVWTSQQSQVEVIIEIDGQPST